MKKDQKICLVLLFFWLIYSGNTLNWQGTGNMTQDNMTIIWSYIKTNFNTSKTSTNVYSTEKQYLSDFATNFSTYLNDQWDPAWNVFLVYLSGTNSDTVVYGYGFRDHWMWYNGMSMAGGFYVSFILWKDYNCYAWDTYNGRTSSDTSLAADVKSGLASLVNSLKAMANLALIWDAAYGYSHVMEENPLFSSSAYTIITSQSNSVNYFGRFCSKGYYTQKGLDSDGRGAIFFLQMR